MTEFNNPYFSETSKQEAIDDFRTLIFKRISFANDTLLTLLKKAHDLLDDENAVLTEEPKPDADGLYRKNLNGWGSLKHGPSCKYCHERGYDGTGLKHKDDCILVLIRRELN